MKFMLKTAKKISDSNNEVVFHIYGISISVCSLLEFRSIEAY